jgi:ribosomal protein S18 acetylase RimI-like enzyme
MEILRKKEVKIRHAKKGDINTIYSMGVRNKELTFSKRERFHTKDELLEWLKKRKENIFLAALIENGVAGFLYAKVIGRHWCMLDILVVDNKYREHGIGSSLLTKLYDMLREQKIDYVQVLEDAHSKKTRKFWKSKGYKEEKLFVWADKYVKNHRS